MLSRATADAAMTVVAAIAATTANARWAEVETTLLTSSGASLVSALFVPLLTSRYELEHSSSTAHEGGKP